MGPIHDQQGQEQGGVSSSDFYKIFSQELLQTAQDSALGVPLGPLTVSAVGQADDTALLSNNIHQLYFLLHLTTLFCAKYQVKLSSEKTKLQVYHKKELNQLVDYVKGMNPIKLDGKSIDFVSSTEHVGLLRSTSGNLPSLLARIASHKKALGAILHSGMARSHRGNPAASIRKQEIYANPVLFSGLGSLVLNDNEVNVIDQHHKETLRNLQRLLPLTPQAVIFFLAGTLPGTAFLHLRQLSIFGIITRMPDSNIIRKHATNIYSFEIISPKSWFHQIRELCLQYSLPHPSLLLSSPILKSKFKNLVKKNVVDFWEQKLRHDSSPLESLQYFHPEYMSLSSPHPIWKTAGASPTKVVMASVQALLISGRFRTEALCSHWSTNSSGFCKLSNSCQTVENVEHFLKDCSALDKTRKNLSEFTNSYCTSHPEIKTIVEQYSKPECRLFCQFIIDCSILPEVIASVQSNGEHILTHLFTITRIWCYTLHRERLKILGRWRNFTKI